MREALTVGQLNEYVSALLGRDPILRNLYVRGEISGFKRHSSGHLYFTLKDEDALIRCVMFRSASQGLGFSPKDGIRVQIKGYISLYVRDGQYQLYAQSMEEEGEGALYQEFLRLKKKLEEEGYFKPERKRKLPYPPKCVGIVTSQTGAALQDIKNIIARRFPAMNIVICPAQVQGEGAADSIANGIHCLNAYSDASVLIVGRGGGSIEELWAFNTRKVADAIFHSRIPVVSAVGHETDYTIADFVADLRAPTPSAAAELVAPEYAALMQGIDALYTRLPQAMLNSLKVKQNALHTLLNARGFVAVEHSIAQKRQILIQSASSLHASLRHAVSEKKAKLEKLLFSMEALSPQAVLERGYALVYKENKILHSVEELEEKMQVRLRLRDGVADARLENIYRRRTP